jgi:hypothetical protein
VAAPRASLGRPARSTCTSPAAPLYGSIFAPGKLDPESNDASRLFRLILRVDPETPPAEDRLRLAPASVATHLSAVGIETLRLRECQLA